MAIAVANIKLALSESEAALAGHAARALGIPVDAVRSLRIKRSSLDARKKNDICFIYTLELTLDKSAEERAVKRGLATVAASREKCELTLGEGELRAPVIVAGLGPAGLFAALTLAENGYRPIVLERGRKIEERDADVEGFFSGGRLKRESNVMFGEGGAGAYSDGKLTTRIKDARVDDVLDVLIRFGADESIRYEAKPHIGTDRLKGVVSRIRQEIERLGGEVRFSATLTGIESRDGAIAAASVTHNGMDERIECQALILAAGQSADDTYRMLASTGVSLVTKPFAIGVRIEHPRELIDRSQFGEHFGNPRLGAAEYHMADSVSGRGVYTFCMCPGGSVIACSNEEGRVITNGMSLHARDGANSNSAVVVQVDERDFGTSPLDGLAFREKLERRAFQLGGGDYSAPASRVGDMLKGTAPARLGAVSPTYRPGIRLVDMREALPPYVAEGVAEGIRSFGRKLRGFDMDDAVITAIESRTSSPVRIERDKMGEAVNMKGLYPAGEGAGYAGGIVSAAVDGMRQAERVMALYKPL